MKNQQLSDLLKKLSTWITGTISFVTAIISFVLILQGNYQLGITIFGILFFLVLLLLLIYLSSAKTSPLIEGGKGVYRFEKYRPFASTGIGLLLIIACSIFLFKASRSFVVNAFKPQVVPTNIHPIVIEENKSITIEQVLISNSRNSVRIETTVKNTKDIDDVITNLSIIAEIFPVMQCSEHPSTQFSFKVGSVSVVNQKNNRLNLTWTFQNTDDPNYSYEAKGDYYYYCTYSRVEIDMPTSLAIPSKSVANIFVEFPNNITLEQENAELLFSDSDMITINIKTNNSDSIYPFYKGISDEGVDVAERVTLDEHCKDIIENPALLNKYTQQKKEINENGGLEGTYLEIETSSLSDNEEGYYDVYNFSIDGTVTRTLYISKYNNSELANKIINQSQSGYKLGYKVHGIYFMKNNVVTIYEESYCGDPQTRIVDKDSLLWLHDYGRLYLEFKRIDK